MTALSPEWLSVTSASAAGMALFRNTRLYGRALGELVPLLAWCPRFRLRADCFFHGRRLTLQLGTGDPIFPSSAPRRYDSLLEERFAREFRRLAPAWDVIREPEPVAATGTLIFPDFAVQHRSNPTRRWLLEIVGFWTPDYVKRKLALYRIARFSNLILCIDEDRNCAEADLPTGVSVVRYRRRLDAAAVLRLIETTPCPADPAVALHAVVENVDGTCPAVRSPATIRGDRRCRRGSLRFEGNHALTDSLSSAIGPR